MSNYQLPEELDVTLTGDSVFYISGPMTGYTEYNYPYFNMIASRLREQGFNILSPSEVDDGEQVKASAGNQHYSYYLKKAMLMMCNADAIIMLEGWTRSKGARAELGFMLDCGMPAFKLEDSIGVLWLSELDAGLEMQS